MKIKLLSFDKNIVVNFKLDGDNFDLPIDDYDLTEYAKRTLSVNCYENWQIDHISKTLKELMLDSVRESSGGQVEDNVNNPSHYMLMPNVEVIDVRKALLNKIPKDTSFESVDHWSRAWEYITRMWSKNGLEDAKKARVYLDWLIESMENRQP